MMLHHPRRKNQSKPTDKVGNHSPKKTQQMLHKKEAESNIQETSNSIGSQWVFIEKQYTSWYMKNNIHLALLWSKLNKRGRKDRFDGLCVIQVQQCSQWSHWEHLENEKCKGFHWACKINQNGDTNEVPVWELCWWLWHGVVWVC